MASSEVTVTPSESASNMPTTVTKGAAPTSASGARKRREKTKKSKTVPPGAIQVAAATPTGSSASPVTSSVIPITGWNDIDLSSHRVDVRPEFTIDASPYIDLVDTVYSSMQSRYSGSAKHIPYALFRWYCMQAWWARMIWLSKANSHVLRTYEKDFLNIWLSGEQFNLPAPVAQYLANAGNFMQGSENWYYHMLPINLDGECHGTGPVVRGWVATGAENSQVDSSDAFWAYAQVPVPGVFNATVINEVRSLVRDAVRIPLTSIAPTAPDGQTVFASRNLLGWRETSAAAHHASWLSTYTNLGWVRNSLPSDVQTPFGISTSSMKWMSERLESVKDLKLHSSSQLFLSVQGSPITAYWLSQEGLRQDVFMESVSAGTVKESLDAPLKLSSRFGMDSRMLAPAFSFGYRLQRFRTNKFSSQLLPEAFRESGRSNYQPWFFTSANSVVDAPPGLLDSMNRTFSAFSSSSINNERFRTHDLLRSTGLDAALILSDMR